jgi:hypothetical protein
MAILAGKKIAVFVEHKFIPEEIEAYRTVFPRLGAEVHFASRIWYPNYEPATATFYSDVDPIDTNPLGPCADCRTAARARARRVP